MKKCETCGDDFVPRTKTARFCGRACLYESMRIREKRTCEQCGNEYECAPWEVFRNGQERKFCTPECYQASILGHRPYNQVEPKKRTCPACGTEFLAGGRGRPGYNKRLCSTACRDRSRYRHGSRAATIAEIDAAYLAGFIDGGGSIILQIPRGVVSLILSAANTSRAVLDWIVATTQVGRVHPGRKASEVNKATWYWSCHAEAAETVIQQIQPYLKIKAAQADLALKTQQRLRDPALKSDRTWQEEYRQQMKTMNRRGPAPTSGG